MPIVGFLSNRKKKKKKRVGRRKNPNEIREAAGSFWRLKEYGEEMALPTSLSSASSVQQSSLRPLAWPPPFGSSFSSRSFCRSPAPAAFAAASSPVDRCCCSPLALFVYCSSVAVLLSLSVPHCSPSAALLLLLQLLCCRSPAVALPAAVLPLLCSARSAPALLVCCRSCSLRYAPARPSITVGWFKAAGITSHLCISVLFCFLFFLFLSPICYVIFLFSSLICLAFFVSVADPFCFRSCRHPFGFEPLSLICPIVMSLSLPAGSSSASPLLICSVHYAYNFFSHFLFVLLMLCDRIWLIRPTIDLPPFMGWMIHQWYGDVSLAKSSCIRGCVRSRGVMRCWVQN